MRAGTLAIPITMAVLVSFPVEASKDNYATPLFKQDLRWIISNDELSLSNGWRTTTNRDVFLDQFWLRRDPTPETYENEFKNEHYRRLRYALEHFSHCTPGYLTDRGRVFVLWGEPDRITEVKDEGHPAVIWRYDKLTGFPPEFDFKFVDVCSCGDYRLKLDQQTDNALQEDLTKRDAPSSLELHVGPTDKRRSRFKYLDALRVPHAFKGVPFTIESDFTPLTDANIWTTFKIDIPSDRLGKSTGDFGHAQVRAVLRFLTLTGRVAELIELESQEPVKDSGDYTITRSLPLRPGRYRLDVVLHDVVADRVGTHSRGITVSTYEPVRERFHCAVEN
jgi:GWxTD domain-containing protein